MAAAGGSPGAGVDGEVIRADGELDADELDEAGVADVDGGRGVAGVAMGIDREALGFRDRLDDGEKWRRLSQGGDGGDLSRRESGRSDGGSGCIGEGSDNRDGGVEETMDGSLEAIDEDNCLPKVTDVVVTTFFKCGRYTRQPFCEETACP